MDGDARGIGEGIEGSRRGSLILSRGSSPARWFGGDQPPVATGVMGTENRPGREGGRLDSWSGPRPNGRPGALFSIPLCFSLLISFFCKTREGK